MGYDMISLLGIPVHKVGMTEAVKLIEEMIQAYKKDRRPRYVATVNVDFLSNTWGLHLHQTYHPELLDSLRRADLVTADGMPIVWLSKILGTPLPGRVTGADMVYEVAKLCEEKGRSLFLFGAKEGLGQEAAEKLQKLYPQLKIAGVLSPYVAVEGKGIVDADERDQVIVDTINQSQADVLLIALGNPKQELWFKRVQKQLNVPVSIGVGGALNFIVGEVKRAPRWIQEAGLEWLFRIAQEPRRLWRRYASAAVNLACMAGPLLLLHAVQKLFFVDAGGQAQLYQGSFKGLKSCEIELPAVLSAASCKHVMESPVLQSAAVILLDFSKTQKMDPEGLGILQELYRYKGLGKSVYCYGIRPFTRLLLKLHRMTQIIDQPSYPTRESLGTALASKTEASKPLLRVEDKDAFRILQVEGSLCYGNLGSEDYLELMDKLDGKNCIVDLSQCPFVDGSGLGFLLKVRRRLLVNNRLFVLCGLNPNATQTLRRAQLHNTVAIAQTIAEALLALKNSDALVSPKHRA